MLLWGVGCGALRCGVLRVGPSADWQAHLTWLGVPQYSPDTSIRSPLNSVRVTRFCGGSRFIDRQSLSFAG